MAREGGRAEGERLRWSVGQLRARTNTICAICGHFRCTSDATAILVESRSIDETLQILHSRSFIIIYLTVVLVLVVVVAVNHAKSIQNYRLSRQISRHL